MLAYIGYEDGFVKLPVDFINDIQRSHKTTFFHGKRMFFLPCCNLREPFTCIAFFYIFGHFGECFFGICNDWDIYMDVSGNRSSINVNMYNLCIGSKLMEFSCNTVIETGTDGEKNITVADSHIGSIGTMHTQISYKKWMRGGNGTSSHDCGNHWYLGSFCYLCKNFLCIGNIYTASCKEKRFSGFLEDLEGTFQLPDMYSCVRFITTNVDVFGVFGISKFSHNVFGKINENRSWSSCTCDIKSFFDDTSKIFSVSDSNTVFGNASGDSNDINFLESIITNQMSGYLPCKTYKGYTVIIGSGKTSYQVCSSRTTCNQTYTYLPRSPGIGVRLVNKSLFMSGKDNVNSALLV